MVKLEISGSSRKSKKRMDERRKEDENFFKTMLKEVDGIFESLFSCLRIAHATKVAQATDSEKR